mmetsp:Transcript_24602/g.53017  ORF Transcript_24602/g.53017 Transcript_24602/m.53017 type:complete len:209 (-) Transcript_24602:417-1043(-)
MRRPSRVFIDLKVGEVLRRESSHLRNALINVLDEFPSNTTLPESHSIDVLCRCFPCFFGRHCTLQVVVDPSGVIDTVVLSIGHTDQFVAFLNCKHIVNQINYWAFRHGIFKEGSITSSIKPHTIRQCATRVNNVICHIVRGQGSRNDISRLQAHHDHRNINIFFSVLFFLLIFRLETVDIVTRILIRIDNHEGGRTTLLGNTSQGHAG